MGNHRSYCAINLGLEVFGDKWSLIIIRGMMFEGKRHFRELLQSDEKIASNILTDRLAMLEREGIITKESDPEHKQKIIYSLTQKGIDLLPILTQVVVWSFKYMPIDIEVNRHAKIVAEGGNEMQEAIKQQLRKEHLRN
ncbi:MAG: winged helix-turn-helix transcriptional regulator [Sphingobacteriales bacterium]